MWGSVSTVLGCRLVKCNNQDTYPCYEYYKKPEKYEFDKIVKSMLAWDDIHEDTFYENYVKYYDANSLYH